MHATPTMLLFDVANSVIRHRWNRVRNTNILRQCDRRVLLAALKYLGNQEGADSSRKPTTTSKETVLSRAAALISSVVDWFPTVLFGLIGAFISVGGIYVIVCEILLQPSVIVDLIIGTGIIVTVCSVVYIFRDSLEDVFDAIFGRIPSGRFSEFIVNVIVAVAGVILPAIVPSEWKALLFGAFGLALTVACYRSVGPRLTPIIGSWTIFYETKVFDSDRAILLSALNPEHDEESNKRADNTSLVDAQVQSRRPLPAPPGLTEIVLDTARSDVFKRIRWHLASIRFYHQTVFWFVVGLSLALAAIGFSKLLGELHSAGDYVKAFGSFGLGAGMLWFLRGILHDHRVSQVSLALFESHVAEIRSALDEIPQSCDPSEKSRLRMNAWKNFRIGLNDLWISERKSMEGTR